MMFFLKFRKKKFKNYYENRNPLKYTEMRNDINIIIII